MCSSDKIEKGNKIKIKEKAYRDEPRYPIINEYEKEFRDNYRSMLGLMVGEITKKMSDYIR